jgi:PAS domain S-box-containing protein
MSSDENKTDLDKATWWSALSEASLDAEFVAEAVGDPITGFRVLYVNSHGARLLGMEPAELVGRMLDDVASPLEGEFRADLVTAITENRSIRRITRSIAPELHASEAEFRIVPFDGKVAMSLIDRSSAYAAQVANAFLSQLLATQIETSLTASALLRPTLDADGTVTDIVFEQINDAGARMLGSTRPALQGRTLSTFSDPTTSGVIKIVERCHRSQQIMGVEYDARGSRMVGEWVQFQLAPVGDYIVMHATDVSKSRREEAAFRAIVEHTAEFVGLSDTTGLFRYLNPHAQQMLGLAEADVRTGSIALSAVPEDRSAIIGDFLALKNGEREMVQRRIRVVDHAGAIRTTVGSSVALRTPGGTFDGIVTVATDLTEQIASEDARNELAAELAIAEQRERERLAESLHDGPVQDLTAISMKLGAALDRHEPYDSEVLALLQTSEDAVVRTISELRLLMFELSAPDLEGVGLGHALRMRADRLFDGFEVQVHAETFGEDPPTEIAVTLFRIGQEALVNARKHARAHNVTIRLGSDPRSHHLEVSDDGVGAEESVYERRLPGHLGIGVMLDRARYLGGECTISGTPGKGTSVRVSLPKRTD